MCQFRFRDTNDYYYIKSCKVFLGIGKFMG
jgi:hypothetical protein